MVSTSGQGFLYTFISWLHTFMVQIVGGKKHILFLSHLSFPYSNFYFLQDVLYTSNRLYMHFWFFTICLYVYFPFPYGVQSITNTPPIFPLCSSMRNWTDRAYIAEDRFELWSPWSSYNAITPHYYFPCMLPTDITHIPANGF